MNALINGLLALLYWLIALFMAPGYAIGHFFSAHPPMLVAFLCALVFWCVVFTILGAMQDSIRGFLSRNNTKKK